MRKLFLFLTLSFFCLQLCAQKTFIWCGVLIDGISDEPQKAADLLGMKDQLGSIEAGKLADVVAVDGDPLKDPQVFGRVVFVMKEGVVYKQ